MSVGSSNTYAAPSQGSSIAISRTQFNSSLRALLQNFYSSGAPDSDNLQENGAALASTDYDGMLYRSTTTGMLYIADSAITVASGRTNRPIGGTFTRFGLAWRQQGSLAAAAANIATFDVGEAFVVVRDTGGSANNRMYFRVATTGTFNSDFVDVGIPPVGSITATSLSDYSISGIKLANSLERAASLTVTPRIIVNSFANTQETATTAAIYVTGSGVPNVSIGFSTGTNSSLIKQNAATAGLSVQSALGVNAPIRANVFLQTTITGGTSETTAPLVPAGVVVAWAGSTAPAGWQLCDGTAISRTDYAALFAICGSTFGNGDGVNTFNVPDARGRAVHGTSATLTIGSTSTAAGATFNSTSSSDGPTTHTLTTVNYQLPAIPKDGATNALVTGVGAHATHTHTITHPGISMNYIIKL